jgi:hypothetical protein
MRRKEQQELQVILLMLLYSYFWHWATFSGSLSAASLLVGHGRIRETSALVPVGHSECC